MFTNLRILSLKADTKLGLQLLNTPPPKKKVHSFHIVYSLKSIFFLQLQLEKVFLISQSLTAVRFIKLSFSPLRKHIERKPELPNKQKIKHSSAKLSTHTLLAANGDRKKKVFNINPFHVKANNFIES